jgi:hypothetical protein
MTDNNGEDWAEIEGQPRFASPAQADRIAGELLAATWDEADTNERYPAGARRQVGAMGAELSKSAEEMRQLRQECEAMIRSRDESLAERDRLTQERDDALR